MDLLSTVLAEMRLQGGVIGDFNLGGGWGIGHPQIPGICLHLIVDGICKVVTSDDRAQDLGAGDIVIFPHGGAHDLVTDRRQSVRPVSDILRLDGHSIWIPEGRYKRTVHRYIEADCGPKTRIVDIVFGFHDSAHHPLLTALPDMIVLRRGVADLGRWVEAVTDFIGRESEAAGLGHAAATGLIADLLFVQAVRAFLAVPQDHPPGWIQAMTNKPVAKALGVIHGSPAVTWTVASLARTCHMSRAKFARDFMKLLGKGPISYLTDWRMHLAARDLAAGVSVTVAAERAGYASSTTFTRAFERNYHVSPGRYRHTIRT